MTHPLHIGILGCANVATRSILPSIQSLPDSFRLVGVASRSAEKAASTASLFNTRGFKGYKEILQHQPLDAVYIPLPNSLHAEWVGAALDCGVHVLVEKPSACSLEEAEKLLAKASAAHLVLMETFQFRFHRQIEAIREIVESGEIGEVRHLSSWFGFPPFPDPENIRYKKELAGGSLLDAATYPIRISQMFLGSDLEVTGAQLKMDPEKGVDIFGSGFLRQTHGELSSSISFGFDNFYQCSLTIWGSKGKLHTNRIFTPPPNYQAKLEIQTAEGSRTVSVEADNAFENMLKHFSFLVNSPVDAEEERTNVLSQAKLLQQFGDLVHD